MTDPMELVGRLENGSDRFLKWAYKEPYSGAPVISIPRHPDNIDALLTEAAACIREMVEWRPMSEAPKDRIIIAMARYVTATAGSPTFVGWDGNQWCEFTRHAPSPMICWGWKERDVLGAWPSEPRHVPPAPGADQ